MHDRSGVLAARTSRRATAPRRFSTARRCSSPGARIGVVGPNGSERRRLPRLLAGLGRARRGSSSKRRPPTLTVGHLAQEVDARPDETLLEYLERRTGERRRDRAGRTRGAARRRARGRAGARRRPGALPLARRGRLPRPRAREASAQVGLDRLDRPLGRLSGGEAARAKLAAILLPLRRPAARRADERPRFRRPQLLERFVSSTPSAPVLVSHDRAFPRR